MESFKKKLRLLAYAMLILLASKAAGIGGAPLPRQGRKEERYDIKIEMIDSKEEETESEQIEVKK